jgi:hypothetical protein
MYLLFLIKLITVRVKSAENIVKNIIFLGLPERLKFLSEPKDLEEKEN